MVNGSVYEDKEAVISVYDHGFLYGIGLFETFRTYEGNPFLLSQHLDRMRLGCAELGIQLHLDEQRLRRQIAALLQENSLQDAYFRYTISAGIDLLGLPGGDYQEPTEVLHIKPLPPRDQRIYSQGKSLQLLKLPRNTPEGLVRFKSLHYMNNILAKRELQSYPWADGAEGLFLTEEGFLAEGIVSNLFFIKEAVCYTPSLETGILPGITRSFVMREAEQISISVHEGYFGWDDLLQADEVFITNSIQEIVPITRIFTVNGDRYTVGAGMPGNHTLMLINLYQGRIGRSL